MRAGRRHRIAGLAALLVLGACSAGDVRDAAVPVKPPMSEARVWRDRLFVRLTPGERLGSVVAIDIAPLVPGMNLEQAEAIVGFPTNTRHDDYGTYYSFSSPPGVELVHLTGPTSGGRMDKWVVWAQPSTEGLGGVFRGPFQELLNRTAPVTEVTIHEQGRPAREAFSAHIAEGRVTDLEWYSIADAPE